MAEDKQHERSREDSIHLITTRCSRVIVIFRHFATEITNLR